MSKFAVVLFPLVLVMCPRAFADLAAIHADKLPQETAVLAALDDAKQLEPYSRSWTNDWKYPVPKDEAAARLGKDLGFLTLAVKNHPDNAELLLLTGLVARYGYNLDLPDTYDKAVNSLEAAQKISPADVRAPWFRASLLCQTSQPKPGADVFLEVEAGHQWNQLPISFWDDYMECATVNSIPAHVLRAADHLAQLRAPDSQMRTFLTGIAHKRFEPFDAEKTYEPKDVWRTTEDGDNPSFTSTTCGVRLRARVDWAVNQLGLNKGTCVGYFSTGPYQATVRSLRPSILLLVKRPEAGQTLEQFLDKFKKDASFIPFTPAHCPAARCIAAKGIQAGMYKEDGDGHGRMVAFERDQPAFPGLIFESPAEPPKPDAKQSTQYFRPSQIQQRISGKLYYLVLLDAAASIEEPATKDFDFFLENLIVE